VLNEVGVEEARRKLDEWLVFHGHV
jgi:hypothetical protein